MNKFRYITSCNFSLFYPKWSARIQNYLQDKMEIIRCCTEKYRVKDFEDKMAPINLLLWRIVFMI